MEKSSLQSIVITFLNEKSVTVFPPQPVIVIPILHANVSIVDVISRCLLYYVVDYPSAHLLSTKHTLLCHILSQALVQFLIPSLILLFSTHT